MPQQAKILIIDDDEDYRASTRALLEGEGHEVREASSGPDGLGVACEYRPDLIVLDVMMESISEGYSVVQAIKFVPKYESLRSIPILMVSSVEEDPAHLFGWIGDTAPIAPDAYMTKPLDIPKFLARVRELLNR